MRLVAILFILGFMHAAQAGRLTNGPIHLQPVSTVANVQGSWTRTAIGCVDQSFQNLSRYMSDEPRRHLYELELKTADEPTSKPSFLFSIRMADKTCGDFRSIGPIDTLSTTPTLKLLLRPMYLEDSTATGCVVPGRRAGVHSHAIQLFTIEKTLVSVESAPQAAVLCGNNPNLIPATFWEPTEIF